MRTPRHRLLPALSTLAVSVTAASVVAVAGTPATGSAQAATPTLSATPHLSWRVLDSGSTSHFRGLAAVSRDVVWLGGYDGTVLRTVDGGQTWGNVSPPLAVKVDLQFRDISATDANHAVAMAAGVRGDSRLFVTADGGRTWRQSYKDRDPGVFFDCMSFSDAKHGLVLSDPVDGRFRILATTDGGQRWRVLSEAGMPAALPGEAAFAASGECLTTSGRDAWFGSGGGATARVFHSSDGGRHWSVHRTPVPSGPSAGINGIAVAGSHQVVVGGDFANPSAARHVAAHSANGRTWRAAAVPPSGYRSGVTFTTGSRSTVLAVGLTGSEVSRDAGRTWSTFDTGSFDTVGCAPDGACWASGAGGRVAVLS